MKLGTFNDGTRDGRLILVSSTLDSWVDAEAAVTLQAALEDWATIAPLLQRQADHLNGERASDAHALNPAHLRAPLPRAYQWCDGSAYLSHAELVRRARNADMPQSLYADPLIYQGGSDTMLGARDDIVVADEAYGIDLEAEIAVVIDDVPMGISAEDARQHIKLVMILNDVSLRNIIPPELAKGFGFFQSKPPTAFSMVAVTPDELGDAWDGTKISLPLISHVNGIELGRPNAGVDLNFDFPTLIAHAAHTRPLGAGTIIGSGTVSNRDRAVGSSCLAERRMLEIIDEGKPTTPFLRFGDRVHIDMLDVQGRTIFGSIEQTVVAPSAAIPAKEIVTA